MENRILKRIYSHDFVELFTIRKLEYTCPLVVHGLKSCGRCRILYNHDTKKILLLVTTWMECIVPSEINERNKNYMMIYISGF